MPWTSAVNRAILLAPEWTSDYALADRGRAVPWAKDIPLKNMALARLPFRGAGTAAALPICLGRIDVSDPIGCHPGAGAVEHTFKSDDYVIGCGMASVLTWLG